VAVIVLHVWALLLIADGAPNLNIVDDMTGEGQWNENVDLTVSIAAVDEDKEGIKNMKEQNTSATIILGGSKGSHTIESVSSTSFCQDGLPPLPSIRFASSGCHFHNPSSLLVCGGRENLFSLSSSCLLYTQDKDSWEEAWTLPRAVAGAATICMEDRMILLGGVHEEDYYQGEDTEGGDYYDYSTEVVSSQVLEFDMRDAIWREGPGLPEPSQGGCGLAWEGSMMVIGGKNDKDCSFGSDKVLVQTDRDGSWADGPRMKHSRFHHGCVIMEIFGQKGVVVAGGLGTGSFGDSVEFLPLQTDMMAAEWAALPKLGFPHPNLPILGQLGGRLFVHGGGGFPYPGGEDKTEVLMDRGWRSISGLGITRSFGLGISVPARWMNTCRMEPNFGIHSYYRKQGQARLNKEFWFCHGEKLEVPFLSPNDKYSVAAGCTVPGCQFSQVPTHLTTAGTFGCKVQDRSRVRCEISCKEGYRPWKGEHSSICTREKGGWRNRFLECYKEEGEHD